MSSHPTSPPPVTTETPTKQLGRRLTEISIAPGAAGSQNHTDAHGSENASNPISEKEKSIIFSYFFEITVSMLREICRFWRLRITGKKDCLVSRCYLQVISSRATPSEYISSNPHCPDFFKTVERIKKLRTLPPLHNIKLMSDEIYRDDTSNDLAIQESGAGGADVAPEVDAATGSKNLVPCAVGSKSTKGTFFTLSEYARLYVILRDNERARQILRASKRVLSASELDAGVSQDEWWQTIVEELFNDEKYHPTVSFSGLLEAVDSSQPPKIYRYASTLKNHFNDMGPRFTRVYENWSATGCSDPANVLEYCKNGKGEMTSLSSKLLLVCYICKLDTSNPDEEFVEPITKTMRNSRKRGLDLGLGGDLESDVLDSLSIPSTYGKRRKNEEADMEKRNAETLNRISLALEKALVRPEKPESDLRMRKIQKRSELLDMLLKAQGAIEKATKSGIQVLIDQANLHMKELLQEVRRLDGSSSQDIELNPK